LGLLWRAAFWPWFRNRPAESRQVNDAERTLIRAGKGAGREAAGPVPWRRILGSRSFWFLCGMYGGCGPAGNFMLLSLPYYLRDHRRLSPETTTWILEAQLAVGFVACTVGGVVSDRLIRRWGSRKWGRRATGLFVLTLAGLTFAASVWVENPWALGLLLSLAQFGNDLMMGPAWAA